MFFPQGIVTDDAFCNRDRERQHLAEKVMLREHTVLTAPRRYGKTSLITQVIKENQWLGVRIDLFFILSQEELLKLLVNKLEALMRQMLPKAKAHAKRIIDGLAKHNARLAFSFLGQQVVIECKQATEQTLSDLLLSLDQIACHSDTVATVVFDEFQQIGVLKEHHAIEAAIRHAVEQSQYITYIFCGSQRHLLNKMFSDRSRPLYRLCDLMKIERIATEHYLPFLQGMAQQKWAQAVPEKVLYEVLGLTENHPYYVNALCRRLWRANTPPNQQDVVCAWSEYVQQQRDWIINDVAVLTLNQRKLLTALSFQSTDTPLGHAFCQRVGLAAASIQKTLASLLAVDMVYQNTKASYAVLDPAIASFLRIQTIC